MKHVIIKNHIAKRRLLTATPVSIKKEVINRLSEIRARRSTVKHNEEVNQKKDVEIIPVNTQQNIWNRFEYIACVCYTGYIDRFELLKKELERVGIKNPQVHWDFPSPYKDFLLKSIPMTKFNSRNGCFFIGHNHYRAIATAYNLGCKSCLVIEDDIRFLKDLSIIKESLQSLPEDYNIAMLDTNKPSILTDEGFLYQFSKKINPYWSSFDCLGSAGCYAMDRRCMEKILSLLESPAKGNGTLANIDHYFRKSYLGNDMHMYVSHPQLAMQHSFDIRHYSQMNEYYRRRKLIGSERSDYAEGQLNQLSKMEIVFVGDENYVRFLRMSAATYIFHNPNAHITYVSPRKVKCPSGIDNFVIEPPKNMKHRKFDRITDATYIKLMLTKLPYSKILLVDADTLCLHALDELWNRECKYISLCESHSFGKKQAEELKHTKYGLSGVMLMNLDELRKDDFSKKAFIPFDSSFLSLWCHEESILNYRFFEKLEFIDIKYNYCHNRKYDNPLSLSDVSILHFPGKNKSEMIRLFISMRGIQALV